ncbi:MAG: BppU family phage baseplate upper protein [Peptostreptococcaceae bacterium]|nr:BppU family phage baseplate upper protein [Peptostreptococcaceae bacterium]
MNTKIIKLDLNKSRLYEKIKAKQGDTESRFLLFQLFDGALPFSLKNRSVRAYMIKPDSKEVFNDLIINDRIKGYCTLELTNQVLAAPGTVKIELMITEGTKKLTSSVFELEVDKSINSEKSIVSTNEFTALLNGLASLSEYDNYKNELKDARDGEVNVGTNIRKIKSQLEHIILNSTNWINIKMFNVVGDGVTDDTENIRKACESCGKNNVPLYVPPGIYIYDSLITLEDIYIFGDDFKNTIFKKKNGNIIENSFYFSKNIKIENITIDNSLNSYSGVKCNNNVENLIMKNVRITACDALFSAVTTNYPITNACEVDAKNVDIENLIVNFNNGHGLNIICSHPGAIYKISKSEFNYNGQPGTQAIGLVGRSREDGENFNSITIDNCIAHHNTASGIAPHSCNNITIIDCDSYENGEHGFVFMDGKNSTITGCKANKNKAAGLRIQGDYTVIDEDGIVGWNGALVTDNNFSKNVNGIVMGYNVRNVDIKSNTITEIDNYTIFIQKTEGHTDCKNINILGNTLNSKDTKRVRPHAPVCGYVTDSTIKIDNYDLDGNKITYYTLHGSNSFIETDNSEIGDTTNVIKSLADYSSVDWVKQGTIENNIITSSTSGWYMHQRLDYNQYRYLSFKIVFDLQNMNESAPSILLRFRGENGGLLGDKGYRYANLNKELKVTWDLLKDIDRSILESAKFMDFTITGTRGCTIAPKYIIASWSNKLPKETNRI